MSEKHIDTAVDDAAGAGTFSAEGYSGTRDTQTGIWYRVRAYGKDFWLNLVRQFWSIIAAVKPVCGFRLYVDSTDGDLECSFTAGKFWYGGAWVTYAGEVNFTLTDDATNYIYCDTDGAMQVSSSAWPDATEAPHLKVATVVTADGVYRLDTDVTDFRERSVYSVEQAGGTYMLSLRKTYEDFSENALTKTIDLFELRAGHVILDCYDEVEEAFAGCTTVEMRVGTAGSEELMLDHDVKVAQVNCDATVKGLTLTTAGETALWSMGAATTIQAKATATIENLDQLTAGEIVFYVLIAAAKAA